MKLTHYKYHVFTIEKVSIKEKAINCEIVFSSFILIIHYYGYSCNFASYCYELLEAVTESKCSMCSSHHKMTPLSQYT